MLALPLQSCLVPIMGTCVHLLLLEPFDTCLSSSCLPPWKIEAGRKRCWDKLGNSVPVFSNSRNLLCTSVASWISVSVWGAPRPYRSGEISLCSGLRFEATWYCVCSRPVAEGCPVCFPFVHRYILSWFGTFLLFRDLSGTFIAAVVLLGSSLRLWPLVWFCVLKWMWPF